jgi:anti-sigma B factor antagonist
LTDREITGGTILALDGDFDLAQRSRIIEAFEIAASEPLVVIDLDRTRYIDSTVLSCLIRLRKDTSERGGVLILAGPQPMVRRLFDVAGLATFFDIRATVGEVRDAYGFHDGQLRSVELVVASDE